MKNASHLYIVAAIVLGLLLTGTGNVNAQDTTSALALGLKKEIVQEVKKQLIEELKKELVAELKNELSQTGKSSLQETVKDKVNEGSSRDISNVLASFVGTMNGAGGDNAHATLIAKAKQLLQDRKPEGNRTQMNPPQESVPLNTDLIAVVTNNSNPVRYLTVEQSRKLLAGEYKNWNQVGGPDMPVKVIVWSDSLVTLERMLKAETRADAVRLNYLTLMIPAVDRSKGAIGFLPARNMEQLQFVHGHGALKKMAIKNTQDSPAVTPSLAALKDGTYPMVGSASWEVTKTASLKDGVH
jgi:ABC-type phosphate transport system substrate-binding protein